LCSSVSGVIISADADGYTQGTNISTVFEGMTLSSVGKHPPSGLDGSVYSYESELATTGESVFGHNLTNHTEWYFDEYPASHHPNDFGFRADFDMPANMVSIDIIADDTWDYASLRTYDSSGTPLESYSNYADLPVVPGYVFSATIQRDSFDIAYVIVGGIFANSASAVYLDNLTANIIPEPGTVLLFGFGGLALLRTRRK